MTTPLTVIVLIVMQCEALDAVLQLVSAPAGARETASGGCEARTLVMLEPDR